MGNEIYCRNGVLICKIPKGIGPAAVTRTQTSISRTCSVICGDECMARKIDPQYIRGHARTYELNHELEVAEILNNPKNP